MPKRLLLADDQPDNRIIFSTILQHGGYEVITAGDGREAVALAQSMRPDLILMDLMMPVMDGWMAFAELQRDPVSASIPVFAISAHGADDGVARDALRSGFAGYLGKPLDPRSLLTAVGRWFEHGAAPGAGPDPGVRPDLRSPPAG
jgi:two-component system, cell cycle response regulator DivK